MISTLHKRPGRNTSKQITEYGLTKSKKHLVAVDKPWSGTWKD